MRDLLLKTYIKIRHDERGVTLVEYGIAISLAVLLGGAALLALSNNIGDAMNNAGAKMP